jgi:histidine ammonia-lyase
LFLWISASFINFSLGDVFMPLTKVQNHHEVKKTKKADTEKKKTITLDGHSLSLDDAFKISSGAHIKIRESAKKQIMESRKFIENVISKPEPIYGVNTGFGYFANTRIGQKDLEELQLNLLKSHASGHGTPLSIPEVRLAMTLRLNVLVKGYTGVRWELCQQLLRLIQADIYPVVPEHGSVGASGDLAPLAHLALPITGHGKVFYKGKIIQASRALKLANITPLKIKAKEGLSLINGTQIMLSVGGYALAKARDLLMIADKVAALSFEASEGLVDSLHEGLHEVRNQRGQIETAKNIRKELQGSDLFLNKVSHRRVQDPYSLRCVSQVHGPTKDAIRFAVDIVERELNAITDNPLIFMKENRIVSGGNFHGQYLALAFDTASIGISELSSISERRLELLLNPHFSGLAAFLSPKDGIHSGYMATQYLSASLVNENKIFANPACTDSIPGNVGVEDHVSMGMTSANKFKRIVKNVGVVLAVELLAAAQAIDLRRKLKSGQSRENLKLGKGTQKTYDAIRAVVPMLEKDRIVSDDVEKAVYVIENEIL